MKPLQIVKAKPNPAGKDRNRWGATPQQLAAEWVDFRNTGSGQVDLSGVELYHKAYSSRTEWKWAKVIDFTGSLGPGKVVRVHSGRARDLAVIPAAELAGADYHVFTGSDNYTWNNAEGDAPSLFERNIREWIDQAGYDPYPPEGAVLIRSGAKLVPAAVAAMHR